MARPWWSNVVRGEKRALAAAVLWQWATGAAGVALLATSAWLMGTAAGRPSIAVLGVAIVGVRFFGLARGVSRYVERLATHRATLRLLGRLQADLFPRLARLGPAWMYGRGRGDVLARMVGDVESLNAVFVRVAVPAASSALLALLVIAFLGSRGIGLAIVAATGWTVVGVVLPALSQRLGMRRGAMAVRDRSRLAEELTDLVRGLPDLTVFDGTNRHVARLEGWVHGLARIQASIAQVTAVGSGLSSFAVDITAVAVLVMAAGLAGRGALDRVQAAVVLLASLAAFETAQTLAAAFQGLGASRAAAGRLRDIVEAVPAVRDPIEAVPCDTASVLAAHGLTFFYRGERSAALDGLSFTLRVGRVMAVVGASGSGKSTLVSLLLRHWDIGERMLTIDGVDLRSCPVAGSRRLFSAAVQPVDLLTGTLRENLEIARPGASDGAMIQALETAGFGPALRQFPEGLGTWIGEHGAALSGGQRQRLALARALLRPAPFLLLDEPTAHLDGAGEADVFSVIGRERASRGVLLTTHRIAGLSMADEILVLHEGRVIQRGCFDELAAVDGWFRRMLALQRSRLPGN